MNSLSTLFGRALGQEDFVGIFSIRLDETGTDGLSAYAVVAGAVSTADGWQKLEHAWAALCPWPYHWHQFCDRSGPYAGWSNLKRSRFVDRQEKLINKHTTFRIAYGVERAVHAEIKARMKGIKGFHADSDYGLCLRALLFHTSEQLLRIDGNHRIQVLVEDGPWASGALKLYQGLTLMTAKRRPAKHAHRLSGFAVAPKGQYRSLEVADYIAGSELKGIRHGQFAHMRRGPERLALMPKLQSRRSSVRQPTDTDSGDMPRVAEALWRHDYKVCG